MAALSIPSPEVQHLDSTLDLISKEWQHRVHHPMFYPQASFQVYLKATGHYLKKIQGIY
jgi:hypothetical protein